MSEINEPSPTFKAPKQICFRDRQQLTTVPVNLKHLRETGSVFSGKKKAREKGFEMATARAGCIFPRLRAGND